MTIIEQRPDGVALHSSSWIGPESGHAWSAELKARRAMTIWEEVTSQARSDSKLSHEGRQAALMNGQGPAIKLLAEGEALLSIAEGAARALEDSLIAPFKPGGAIEAARFAEIRTFAGGKSQAERTALVREALAEGDTEFLRAMYDAPARFTLLPPAVRGRIGQVLLSTIAPERFAEWQTLTAQNRLASESLAAARRFIASDLASNDRQWREREADQVMRARLRPLSPRV